MIRNAYLSVYRRFRNYVPIVVPLAGKVSAYSIPTSPSDILPLLVGRSVLSFETALEKKTNQRLLTARDLHAYTLANSSAHETAEAAGLTRAANTPDLVPIWSRPPHLFIIERAELPPSVMLPDGTRVVTDEWLVREYLGVVGQRFDLLAVLSALLPDLRT